MIIYLIRLSGDRPTYLYTHTHTRGGQMMFLVMSLVVGASAQSFYTLSQGKNGLVFYLEVNIVL